MEASRHPYVIHTYKPAPPPRGVSGNRSIKLDEAFADSLEAAFTAARTLVEDAGDTPVSRVTITLDAGHCVVNGETKFSAAWR